MKSVIVNIFLTAIASAAFVTNSFAQETSKQTSDKYKLVWSDEFNYTGKPDSTIWTAQIGGHGWGNGESQYYTDKIENAFVKDGFLTIKALKEDYKGSKYTSARLITQGKKEFKHGRIEIRAKLPKGKGTWPAFWMLGAKFDKTEEWPTCGEIDILEYVGREPGVVQSAIHNPSSYGATINVKQTSLPGAEDNFHIYGLTWDENELQFYIDNPKNVYYTYNPQVKNAANWPFNQNMFILLNLALGGGLGGEIDNSIFPQSYIIDYVRVYQKE